MTNVIIKCELVNNNNSICIKEHFIKYKDADEKYSHTIKNILLFNNIVHTDDSKIIIKFFRNKKIVSLEYKINEIKDMHINKIIE